MKIHWITAEDAEYAESTENMDSCASSAISAVDPSKAAMKRNDDDLLAAMRRTMVERDIRGRGIRDERVLAAMERVPREEFVELLDRGSAYVDHPLTIGCGQTISQPYMVAYMTEALKLKGKERVLEIGTGSGYQAAVLAELVEEVYTVERHEELSRKAENVIRKLGYRNVHFLVGDGTLGWPENAPYDGIMVTAAAPEMPKPLVEQLARRGRLVAPLGTRSFQQVIRLEKDAKGVPRKETLIGCIFVPLIGEEGFPE